MSTRLLSLAALTIVGTVTAAGTLAGVGVLEQLTNARPDIRWETTSEIASDLDGDGKPDSVLVGYGSKRVIVAVVASSDKARRIQYLEFPIGQAQDGICSVPVKLSAHPLSCENDGGGKLPGCKESNGVVGLTLSDDSCDPINLYWDSDKRSMTWWRN